MSLVTDPDVGRLRRQRHDLQPVDRRWPDLGAGDPADHRSGRALPQRQELDHRGPQRLGTSSTPSGIASRARRAVEQPTTPSATPSRARSTSPGPSTAATRWEPARKIYETGANKQTIGNQIVVEPDSEGGSLFDFFADITNSSNRRGGIGPVKLSYIRSDDRGETWTKPTRVDDMIPMSLVREDTPIDVEAFPCPDPETRAPARSGPGPAARGRGQRRERRPLRGLDGRPLRRRPVPHRPRQHRLHPVDQWRQTWSAPIKVNKTPTTEPNFDQQAFTPSVDVDATARSR